ncbi:MAG TPA: class I SAM-dependent methyltransferase [Acetobacteraceae bacterium]|nr:class I SAM-dependent methyltransferase [Acetobacteraceae bacterium]
MSLSEVFAATERAALWVADMEVLRLHYYHTLRHWRARFAANRAEVAALADERFCRMWEYYLAAVQVGFLNGSNMETLGAAAPSTCRQCHRSARGRGQGTPPHAVPTIS